MATWDDVKTRWSAEWRTFATAATDKWGATVESSWDTVRPKVEAVIAALGEAEANLVHARAQLAVYRARGGQHGDAYQANLDALTARYDTLAAGVMSGSKRQLPDGSPVLGVAWFIIAGGLVLTLVAVCFALAAYEYTMALRDGTALQSKELDARVTAMNAGKELQPSTVTPPATPGGDEKPTDWGSMIGYGIMGTLAVVAVATVIPALRKG